LEAGFGLVGVAIINCFNVPSRAGSHQTMEEQSRMEEGKFRPSQTLDRTI
jgi:hypothetical protein